MYVKVPDRTKSAQSRIVFSRSISAGPSRKIIQKRLLLIRVEDDDAGLYGSVWPPVSYILQRSVPENQVDCARVLTGLDLPADHNVHGRDLLGLCGGHGGSLFDQSMTPTV